MAKNRSQLFRDLDVKPKNPQWAWCAKNETIKRAVFTLWEDEELPNQTWLIHDENSTYKKNGYYDQKKVIDIAVEDKYEILGIVCIAYDINVAPRSIKEVREDFIYKLKVDVQDDKIYLRKTGQIKLIDVIRDDKILLSESSGLNDLNYSDIGSDFPDRALAFGLVVKRNNNVRKAVLKRANGKCEFCGSRSFETKNGSIYLETHHVIYLAKNGADKVTNVIALCSEHHREAHFGKDAEELEKKFLDIIKDRNSMVQPPASV